MCLNAIVKKIKKPTRRVKVGWKVFRRNWRGDLFPEVMLSHYGYDIGVWNVRDGYQEILVTGGRVYERGFHVFVDKNAATCWRGRSGDLVVRKVYVRLVRTVGSQCGYECFEIRMLRLVGDVGLGI